MHASRHHITSLVTSHTKCCVLPLKVVCRLAAGVADVSLMVVVDVPDSVSTAVIGFVVEVI